MTKNKTAIFSSYTTLYPEVFKSWSKQYPGPPALKVVEIHASNVTTSYGNFNVIVKY